MEFCPATPACDLDYFPSPCMCTTTGTTTFAAMKEERAQEAQTAQAQRE